ncbi:MAG: hypothetical protein WD355_02610 [Balneolaceae bacterium]
MIQNQWTPLNGDVSGTDLIKGRASVTRQDSPTLESNFGRLLNSFRERVESESESDSRERSIPATESEETKGTDSIDTETSDGELTVEEEASEESGTDTTAGPEVTDTGNLEEKSASGSEDAESLESAGESKVETENGENPESGSENRETTSAEPAEHVAGSERIEYGDGNAPASGSGSETVDGTESAGNSESEDRISTESDGPVLDEESSGSEKLDGEKLHTDQGEQEKPDSGKAGFVSETGNEKSAAGSGRERGTVDQVVQTDRAGQHSTDSEKVTVSEAPENSRKSVQSVKEESEKNNSEVRSRSGGGDSARPDQGEASEGKLAKAGNHESVATENRQAGEQRVESESKQTDRVAGKEGEMADRFVAANRSSGNSANSENRTDREGNRVPADSRKEDTRLPADSRKEGTPALQFRQEGSVGTGDTPVESVEVSTAESEESISGWPSGRSLEAVEKSIELHNVKAGKIRDQRNVKHLERLSGRGEAGSDRSETVQSGENRSLIAEVLSSESNQQQGQNLSSQEDEMSPLWKELSHEMNELKKGRVSETQQFGMTRLGQIPISNITIRRNLLPGLTQQVAKAAGASSGSSEVWQKHNIEVEKGKNVQISVRKAEGVLQLRLGSSNPELNRLMQQYQHEIRQHLEEECGLEVDLQFDNPEEDTLAEFFDGSNSRRGQGGTPAETGRSAADRIIDGEPAPAIRRFGYNQMEWTI